MMTNGDKAALRAYSQACRLSAQGGQDAAVSSFFAPDAAINMVHPINGLTGPDACMARFLMPLHAAFQNLVRSDDPARSGSSVGMVTAMQRGLATEDQAWRRVYVPHVLLQMGCDVFAELREAA